MARDVEVVLAARDRAQVNVRTQDLLAVVDRAGEELAERIDDAAAAADQDGLRLVAEACAKVVGVIAAPRINSPPMVGVPALGS